jgi:hypothetical protein
MVIFDEFTSIYEGFSAGIKFGNRMMATSFGSIILRRHGFPTGREKSLSISISREVEAESPAITQGETDNPKRTLAVCDPTASGIKP